MRFANKEKIQTLVGKKAIVVDMRSPIRFRDDPIPNTVNWPLRNLSNNLLLEKKKDRPVILFSGTTDDSDLKMGVVYSENLGFDTYITDIKNLK
jgi:hypothetical protein